LTIPETLLQRIHARVADTEPILGQLVATVRRKQPIALVTTMQQGGLRLHIARPVIEEVERKILEDPHMRDRYARHHITREPVLAFWRAEMLPLLRIVDVGEPDLEELKEVNERDRTDLPTAQLSAVLGPGSTWSANHHLTDPGLAQPYDENVLRLVIAIQNVCLVDVQIVTSTQRATLLTNLGIELVVAIGRLDTRGRWLVAAGALATLGAIAYTLRRNPSAKRALADGLQEIVASITAKLEGAYALQREWAEHLPPPLELETTRPERIVARILATAATPLTAEEIRAALATRTKPLTLEEITRELRGHAMFVVVDRRCWQLGRHHR
jgi:hypothetical protein